MKPDWLKIRLGNNSQFTQTKKTLETRRLHTICSSGRCPNQGECWSRGTATFLIAGDICTRSCKFCNTRTGKPLPLDMTEPQRIAESVRELKLVYVVLTSVNRDDLPDLGAKHWVGTIQTIKTMNPAVRIETLIPDFQGRENLIDMIIDARPNVIGHNVETTERLTPEVRSAATYATSLGILRYISQRGRTTKTGLMLGLGETADEVLQTIDDIWDAGCRRLTIGQYLQPSRRHIPVREYVSPDVFAFFKEKALERGFIHVESAPLVRSSYHADFFL
ncbi:MAG: lipoyl synthase [Bacteroidales bacterium]|jgi:lipoic acid synthetase|nr:lipoyl synthase [Bacteroidales bacterium]